MSDEIPKTAEEYLRNKYGAYPGGFSWRDEEKAFNAGILSQTDRIKELESQLAAMTELAIIKDRAIDLNLAELADAKKDQARYQWIRQAGAWESEVGLDLLSGRPELFDEAVDAELALIKDQSNG